MSDKKRLKSIRYIIISLIIIALVSLCTLIIFQYNQYNQVEKRLNTAYSTVNSQSAPLYKLFSTYSEADYLFRLYAINYDEDKFKAYSQKIDTIKLVIDSLAALPMMKNSINNNNNNDENLAAEYLSLKKQVDNLIFFNRDSLALFISEKDNLNKNKTNLKGINTDSIISKILQDSTLKNTVKDTIVKKKEGFFKRVFSSKNDTIVHTNESEIQKYNRMNTLLKTNIDNIVNNNNHQYNSNINKLKSTFEKLKEKEKQLLYSNFILLNNLENGIEKLQQIENENNKLIQKNDFLIYKQNTKNLRNQLIFAISLMVFMVFLLISYQNQVISYERKLLNEKDYADKIAEEKTSVLANVSHEIRSPLNALQGLVKLLKNNINIDNKETIDIELINSVDHNITVINSNINDILSLSKLESDSLSIINESINIHNLIEELITLHTYQAESKGLELINNNLLDKTVFINSNPFRIRQIISNLITNAIKYTPNGSITINSNINNNSTLIINVQDTGIGISDEQKKLVFRKYYVADNKNKIGGYGLGLYISKILSDQIKGKISFTSNLGKGTTFTFSLPLTNIISNNITHTNNLTEPQTIKEIPDDLVIVFIDDSRINLFFIQQIFKDRKNIYFYTNAESALEFIKNNKVDVIITDIKMPTISGWEVLNDLKTDNKYSHIKIFACTSEPLLLEANKNSIKFDGFIEKPINENELVSKILSC